MTVKTATRGRPKGSGVNDASQLSKVQSLLSANPGMKPTTAIKSIGVTDPSAIRRLRDKFNSAPPAEARPPARPTAAAKRTPAHARTKPAITARPAPRATRSRTIEAAPATSQAEAPDPAPVAAIGATHSEFLMSMYSAGVSMATATMQLHVDAFAFALQGSPVACFLRGQMIVSEFAAALLADNAGHGHTRH